MSARRGPEGPRAVSSPRERQDEDEILADVLRRFLSSGEGYVFAGELEGAAGSARVLVFDARAVLTALELEVVERLLPGSG